MAQKSKLVRQRNKNRKSKELLTSFLGFLFTVMVYNRLLSVITCHYPTWSRNVSVRSQAKKITADRELFMELTALQPVVVEGISTL